MPEDLGARVALIIWCLFVLTAIIAAILVVTEDRRRERRRRRDVRFQQRSNDWEPSTGTSHFRLWPRVRYSHPDEVVREIFWLWWVWVKVKRKKDLYERIIDEGHFETDQQRIRRQRPDPHEGLGLYIYLDEVLLGHTTHYQIVGHRETIDVTTQDSPWRSFIPGKEDFSIEVSAMTVTRLDFERVTSSAPKYAIAVMNNDGDTYEAEIAFSAAHRSHEDSLIVNFSATFHVIGPMVLTQRT